MHKRAFQIEYENILTQLSGTSFGAVNNVRSLSVSFVPSMIQLVYCTAVSN